MTRNSMSFQMGFDNHLYDRPEDVSDEEIQKMIEQIGNNFDLILVADHMPESLILLRFDLALHYLNLLKNLPVGVRNLRILELFFI